MSGRLVILRHKKWNVWNQDNQEKVLRDERLHREKGEELQSQQKNRLQEQQRQALLQNNETLSTTPSEHINFFKEIEEGNILKKPNKEYKAENDAKELKRRKQEGVAPWSLSEGISDVKPWYTQTPSSSSMLSSTSKSDKDSLRMQRDKLRLQKQDPLNSFTDFTTTTSSTSISNYTSDQSISNAIIINNQQQEIQRQHPLKSPNTTSSSTVLPNGPIQLNNDMMTQLRKKRLEREKNEKHKASVMLADISIQQSFQNKKSKGNY